LRQQMPDRSGDRGKVANHQQNSREPNRHPFIVERALTDNMD
jgi:hypothetical protein